MVTRSFGRPTFGAPRRRPASRSGQGGFRQGNRRPRGRGMGQHIDTARFINKAEITEKTEHFVPEHQFADFVIDSGLKKNIIAKGYTTPTPIQDRVIPHVLRGEDVVGIANTGTGKTAAFVIPLLNKILLNPRDKIMIVVPTRELALQIEAEVRDFAIGTGISAVCCIGGAGIGPQIMGLRRQHNIVIGTPGRLKDLIKRGFIKLEQFKTIVLDEADRMLDMGFIADMRFLMAGMPTPRHTLFFSATLSPEIARLIKDFLTNPVSISVKTRDTSKNVDQDIIKIKVGETKIDVLCGLLKQPDFKKVLIFGRTKHGVERLAKIIEERGFKASSIHGDKNHSQRQRALQLFKENRLQILVATDVAARGLDIPDVTHVINYDIPNTHDDYAHRIGRTGRGEKKGKALTFVD